MSKLRLNKLKLNKLNGCDGRDNCRDNCRDSYGGKVFSNGFAAVSLPINYIELKVELEVELEDRSSRSRSPQTRAIHSTQPRRNGYARVLGCIGLAARVIL